MKTASSKKWKKIVVQHVGLAGLKKDLAAFEKKYDMPTATFVKKVWGGELDESRDFIVWLSLAEIHQDMMNERKT